MGEQDSSLIVMTTTLRRYIQIVIRGVIFSPLLGLPFVVFAQGTLNENASSNVTGLLNKISEVIINPIIFLLFAAGFVVFIWGLVQFVARLDNEEARATGGKHMLWGIIGMVIMVGVVGIVNIIQNTIQAIGG